VSNSDFRVLPTLISELIWEQCCGDCQLRFLHFRAGRCFNSWSESKKFKLRSSEQIRKKGQKRRNIFDEVEVVACFLVDFGGNPHYSHQSAPHPHSTRTPLIYFFLSSSIILFPIKCNSLKIWKTTFSPVQLALFVTILIARKVVKTFLGRIALRSA